jgi:DNA invertase Pin-like site-specific DNA recombinase
MPIQTLVPVAEYVRMSTDLQESSIPLQQAAIRRYAAAHGYEVVATYSDEGKSGLQIKHRLGLRRLIQDTVSGQTPYRLILVYDVSRWGRFQDTDESAYYEFLCRNAGVAVHYCVEQFENDGTMANAIMKSLKRMMAAEYSRDLSAKVYSGQSRIVAQGFRGGGIAGYGLRRMLVSSDGCRKQILHTNERKNLKADHIILVPGSQREVACIRKIFSLTARRRRTPQQIADELNLRKVKYLDGRQWNSQCVYNILKNEKYMGCNVWGKNEKRFNTTGRRLPPSAWIIKPNAFVPIIDPPQFARVQKLVQNRSTHLIRSDEYLLNKLRRVLAKEGKLTERLLKKRGTFDQRMYLKHFGSMMRAYEMVGYNPSPRAFRSLDGCKKMTSLRKNLLIQLKQIFPSLQIVKRPGQNQRALLEIDNHLQIGVHICRPLSPTRQGKSRWVLRGQPKEQNLPALICVPDKALTHLETFYLIPEFGNLVRKFKIVREGHPWLANGERLESLTQLYELANKLVQRWEPGSEIRREGDVILRERTSTVTIAGKEILLSPVEAALFKMLLRNGESALAAEDLCRVFDKSIQWLRNSITALRRRLGRDFRMRVVTVKGEGYMYKSVA